MQVPRYHYTAVERNEKIAVANDETWKMIGLLCIPQEPGLRRWMAEEADRYLDVSWSAVPQMEDEASTNMAARHGSQGALQSM